MFNPRFGGWQYYDVETGLFHNGFRNYDPTPAMGGRYIQSNPAGMLGGINTYAYVLNNPLRYVDPFGLAVGDWWDLPANYNRATELAKEELKQH